MDTTKADAHAIRTALLDDPALAQHAAVMSHSAPRPGAGLHLAVMTGPYLERVVNGTKTVESRFHRIRSAPLDTVAAGDLVAFKPSGDPVTHIAGVRRAIFLDMTRTPLEEVRLTWQDRIADSTDEFWAARENARWVSLVELDWVKAMAPVKLQKRDRRGWITYGPCCPAVSLF
ncbi:hypothetical protein [Umezawaea tangerina]|uniref:hypothetical protein n=1 Tax=Umezawaea tangerina TaxID=84725 RepID=UPI0011B266BA|nr:hypothetical protein [Umezawaea tangerina]